MRSEPIELTEADRAALGCPVCDSELEAVKVGVILHLTIRHDDDCPVLARIGVSADRLRAGADLRANGP